MSHAFTLVEILIVLAIIALVACIAVPNFIGIDERARIDTTRTFVKSTLEPCLISYKLHIGSFPSTDEGLAALITAPSGKSAKWGGPYIKEMSIPKDPWGNSYQYRFPAKMNKLPGYYDLFSAGPDGVAETEDDIGNWQE